MPEYVNFAPDKKFTMPIPTGMRNNAPCYISHMPSDTKAGICIATVGNSGTHMTIKGVAFMGASPIFSVHTQHGITTDFLMKQPGIKVILMIRDPRDYILSKLGIRDQDIDLSFKDGAEQAWDPKTTFWPEALHLAYNDRYSKLTLHDKIKLQLSSDINVHPPFGNVGLLYQTMEAFINRPNTLVVKFEDMFNMETREETLATIGNFLNLPLNDSIVSFTAQNLEGPGVNYHDNKDKIGYWKKHFNQELNDLFAANEYLVKFCTRFGYELPELERSASPGLRM